MSKRTRTSRRQTFNPSSLSPIPSPSSSSVSPIIQTPHEITSTVAYQRTRDLDELHISNTPTKRRKTSHLSDIRTKEGHPTTPLLYNKKTRASSPYHARTSTSKSNSASTGSKKKPQMSSIISLIRGHEPKIRTFSRSVNTCIEDQTPSDQDAEFILPRVDFIPKTPVKKSKVKINLSAQMKLDLLEEAMDFVYENLDFEALSSKYGMPKPFLKDQFKSYAGHPKDLTHTNLRKSVLDIHKMDLSFLAPNLDHLGLMGPVGKSKIHGRGDIIEHGLSSAQRVSLQVENVFGIDSRGGEMKNMQKRSSTNGLAKIGRDPLSTTVELRSKVANDAEIHQQEDTDGQEKERKELKDGQKDRLDEVEIKSLQIEDMKGDEEEIERHSDYHSEQDEEGLVSEHGNLESDSEEEEEIEEIEPWDNHRGKVAKESVVVGQEDPEGDVLMN
ncbi:uncharacterized protein I206_100756 [Kwoniella pini CBS 10737]|uniref:Uncharacterized protein n=1 Tax=Kwoniella pini CBS 10737 TaxID=1296096 RepID=A0A1B9ID80_9TREE|nr:uncharacterized protein I206_00571 [Kwoniella pini CBS 10737]OCF53270.1 hypothetical protein I206_00571 [Kwoniella pini CBS 10737]